MMDKLYIAFCGEGSTDERLFRNLTEKIIQNIVLEHNLTIEISWLSIKKVSGNSEQMLLQAARKAKEQHILIFHRDADCNNRDKCLEVHFNSGLEKIHHESEDSIKRIVPAIPVQESEAWMLCDKELLRDLLETNLSFQQLELTYQVRQIENIRNPKATIQRAIHNHKEQLTPRKRRLAVTLSDLYERFGTDISIEKLRKLPSFTIYYDSLRDSVKSIFNTP